MLKSEVEFAVTELKFNKAPGVDDITSEEIKSLDDIGLEKMTELINLTYNS